MSSDYKVFVRGLKDDGVWHLDASPRDEPGIEYRLKLAALDQHLRLMSVEVVATKSPREVRTADLRSLRLNGLLGQARAEVLKQAAFIDQDPAAPAATKAAVRPALATTAPRRGRPPLPDEDYERIARRYLELLASGKSRGILQQLAEEEGRPVETVRTWVNVARSPRLQYLSPGTPGQAGAIPGPGLPAKPASKPRRTR